MDQLLTVDEAAERFRMKPAAFSALAKRHGTPFVKAGRRILFAEAALLKLQEALTVRPIGSLPKAEAGRLDGISAAQEALTRALAERRKRK